MLDVNAHHPQVPPLYYARYMSFVSELEYHSVVRTFETFPFARVAQRQPCSLDHRLLQFGLWWFCAWSCYTNDRAEAVPRNGFLEVANIKSPPPNGGGAEVVCMWYVVHDGDRRSKIHHAI